MKLEPNPKVRRFIKSFWPLPPTVAQLSKLNKQQDKLDPYILEKRLNKAAREHESFMKRNFSPDILAEYHDIVERCLSIEHDESLDTELNGFVFRTGISNFHPPNIVMRSRETLRSLLTYLDRQDSPVSIADLGSGEGSISTGLALYPNSIQRAYAIDYNPEAHSRLKENNKILRKDYQEKLKQTLIPVESDYRDSEHTLKHFLDEDKGGVDAILAAYTFNGVFFMKDQILPLIKPDGRVFAYYPSYPSGVNTETLVQVTKAQVEPYGFKYKAFDHQSYFLDHDFLAAEATLV